MSELSADDPRHGTRNGYRNLHCRCDACRRAHADWQTALRRTRPVLAANDPRHGRSNTYTNHACRCVKCCAAHTAAKRRNLLVTNSIYPEMLRDVLRVHHPIMRSETGPFSGCRCGQVGLGQDVIAHVVEHLRAVFNPRAEEAS